MKKINKDNNMNKLYMVLFTILLVALSRILPHPPNFTAVGAVAIFGGSLFNRTYMSILVPLLSIFLSDIVINNTLYRGYYEGFTLFSEGSLVIYASIILMSIIGHLFIKMDNIINVTSVATLSTLLFFVLTNFAVWYNGTLYSNDLSGLLTCYTMAIPFGLNSLLGNLTFSALLFIIYNYSINRSYILKSDFL